jgi:hypothetical protein
MLNEMTAIEANGTWQLKEASTGHRPIGLKWVFKMKKDAAGNIINPQSKACDKRVCATARNGFRRVVCVGSAT